MINLERTRQIISASSVLTPIEKAEWMQLLPSMNDTQIFELMKILAPVVPPVVVPPMQPMPAVSKPLVPNAPEAQRVPQPVYKMQDYKEKELTTPRSANELEIPAHIQTAPQPTPAVQKPAPVTTPSPINKVSPTITPTDPLPPIANPTIQAAANLNVPQKEHIIAPPKFANNKQIKELLKKQPTPQSIPTSTIQPVHSPIPPPPAPTKQATTSNPTPKPVQLPTQPVSLESIISAQMRQQPKPVQKPVEPVPIISATLPTQRVVAPQSKSSQLRTAEDFAKVSADFLHGRDPQEALKDLMNSIIEVSKRSKFFIVIANFEQSPLYKTYVNTGLILLNSNVVQSTDVFENYISNARTNNQPYLTRAEFESFTDFRKDLDHMTI